MPSVGSMFSTASDADMELQGAAGTSTMTSDRIMSAAAASHAAEAQTPGHAHATPGHTQVHIPHLADTLYQLQSIHMLCIIHTRVNKAVATIAFLHNCVVRFNTTGQRL